MGFRVSPEQTSEGPHGPVIPPAPGIPHSWAQSQAKNLASLLPGLKKDARLVGGWCGDRGTRFWDPGWHRVAGDPLLWVSGAQELGELWIQQGRNKWAQGRPRTDRLAHTDSRRA